MSDLIDRQEAIELLLKWADGYSYIETPTEAAVEEFRKLPSAETRMKGKWIYGENDCQDGWFCSVCGFFIPWDYDYYGKDCDFIRDFHVCPHCKAEMVTYTGKKEDTDE